MGHSHHWPWCAQQRGAWEPQPQRYTEELYYTHHREVGQVVKQDTALAHSLFSHVPLWIKVGDPPPSLDIPGHHRATLCQRQGYTLHN